MGSHNDFEYRFVAALESSFHIASEQRGKGLLVLPFRMLRRELLDTVERKNSWGYMGCSTHKVPSLSNTATRSGSGTKPLLPGVVMLWTKSMMDCFALPSLHDGSGSAAIAKDEIASQKASTITAMRLRFIFVFLVCIPYR